MRAYIIDLPVIHNAKPVVRLDRHYVSAYRFMVRKWRPLLPWPTVIVPLSRNPARLFFRALRIRYKGLFRASTLHPALDCPDVKARELGFDFGVIGTPTLLRLSGKIEQDVCRQSRAGSAGKR
jgi:hypothetical protein